MSTHVNAVCRSGYQQLRVIGHIRPYITPDTTKSLVHTLVLSRIDYCNSLLFGISCSLMNKLQVLQHSAARLIFRIKKRAHITPSMISLHWLPVRMRINFKILVITFKCLRGNGPSYLSALLHHYTPERALRSAGDSCLKMGSSRTKFGERAFCSTGPKLWNELPTTLRNEQSLIKFKRDLKTHLFCLIYEVQ